jgi:hypothetical protein
VLGEFFAARPDEIDDELIEEGPHGRLSTVAAKGLTEVSLTTLGEIIGVGAYDDLVEQIAEGPEAESGEAGILAIPQTFRDCVAGAGDADAAADRWVTTAEMAADGWTKEEAREIVSDLRDLARQAASDNRDLFYWWSL